MNMQRIISAVLLIVFAAFLGHNMIPHHHHESIFHVEDSGCCKHEHAGLPVQAEGQHDDDHAGDGHDHCHAFNSVDLQKNKPHQGFTKILLPLCCLQTFESEYESGSLQAAEFLIAIYKPPIRGPVLKGSRVLRGPPSLS